MPLFHARDVTISLQAGTSYDGTGLPSASFTSATEVFVKELNLNDKKAVFIHAQEF